MKKTWDAWCSVWWTIATWHLAYAGKPLPPFSPCPTHTSDFLRDLSRA